MLYLVPENQEDADVVPRGFRRGVLGRADRKGEVVGRLARRLDELQRRHLLRDAVLFDQEVFGLERRHRVAAVIEHGDVDANDVGAGAERRELWLMPAAVRGVGAAGVVAAVRLPRPRGDDDRCDERRDEAVVRCIIAACGAPGGGGPACGAADAGRDSPHARHARSYSVDNDHPCGYSRLRNALALDGVVTFMLAAS